MNEIAARGSRRSFGVSPGAQTATTSPFLTTGEIEFPSKWKALPFFVFFSLTPRSRIATTTPGVLEEHAGTPRVRPIYISGGWRGGGWEGVSQFCSRSSKRLKMPSACDLCLRVRKRGCVSECALHYHQPRRELSIFIFFLFSSFFFFFEPLLRPPRNAYSLVLCRAC